jgi:hypothetical protein
LNVLSLFESAGSRRDEPYSTAMLGSVSAWDHESSQSLAERVERAHSRGQLDALVHVRAPALGAGVLTSGGTGGLRTRRSRKGL